MNSPQSHWTLFAFGVGGEDAKVSYEVAKVAARDQDLVLDENLLIVREADVVFFSGIVVTFDCLSDRERLVRIVAVGSKEVRLTARADQAELASCGGQTASYDVGMVRTITSED